MDYQRIHLTPEGNSIKLYPFVCWHIGAEQSDQEFIDEMIAKVADDPDARWIYLGDGGECVTRSSKGDIFEQTMSIQDQMETLVELLDPIADKGLFGVNGNHGNRVYRETGMSFDRTLCTIMRLPYCGTSVLANIRVHDTSYDVFARHGLTSGRTLGNKVARAAEASRPVFSDIVLTAHSHIAGEVEPNTIAYADNRAGEVKYRSQRQYICGSAYDSRSGYADSKGYNPIIPAHVCLEMFGTKRKKSTGQRDGQRIDFTTFRRDPNHGRR